MAQIPMDGPPRWGSHDARHSVMKVYYKIPRATKRRPRRLFPPHGDIAKTAPRHLCAVADPPRTYIISGGEKSARSEIEERADAPPRVAAVLRWWAKPDENGARCPAARFLELEGRRQRDRGGVIAFARQRLAGFKTPQACGVQEAAKGPLPARSKNSRLRKDPQRSFEPGAQGSLSRGPVQVYARAKRESSSQPMTGASAITTGLRPRAFMARGARRAAARGDRVAGRRDADDLDALWEVALDGIGRWPAGRAA